MTDRKVLLIDDDPDVLNLYQRSLSTRFKIDVAQGPREGLTRALSGDEYAVIVCDLQLPMVDGLSLLGKIRELSPNTVRMMLTGYGDLERALDAVNDGLVFRFLTKPCLRNVIFQSLNDALKQYELNVGNEMVLKRTLGQTVQAMAETFAIHSPGLGGRTPKVHSLVRQLCQRLHFSEAWEFELAASLSQLGIWSLPNEIKARVEANLALNVEQAARFAEHAVSAAQLLVGIPHLQDVTRMLAASNRPLSDFKVDSMATAPRWVLGAQLVRLATDFDRMRGQLGSGEAALDWLKGQTGSYFPEMLACLGKLVLGESSPSVSIRTDRLASGMVVGEDLTNQRGLVLVTRGQRITPAVLEFLRQCDRFSELPGSVRVQQESLSQAS